MDGRGPLAVVVRAAVEAAPRVRVPRVARAAVLAVVPARRVHAGRRIGVRFGRGRRRDGASCTDDAAAAAAASCRAQCAGSAAPAAAAAAQAATAVSATSSVALPPKHRPQSDARTQRSTSRSGSRRQIM